MCPLLAAPAMGRIAPARLAALPDGASVSGGVAGRRAAVGGDDRFEGFLHKAQHMAVGGLGAGGVAIRIAGDFRQRPAPLMRSQHLVHGEEIILQPG